MTKGEFDKFFGTPVITSAGKKMKVKSINYCSRSVLAEDMDSGLLYPLSCDSFDVVSPAEQPSCALAEQVGGSHYSMAIQPVEFISSNKLPFLEGCVIKRMCRHRKKNKAEDLEKAIHEIRLIAQLTYNKSI